EVSYLGLLPRSGRPPLLVLGAAGCYSCDVDQAIYFVPPERDSVPIKNLKAFSYPGTLRNSIVNSEDTLPFFKARMFLGQCLDSARTEAVWFQSSRDSTNTWHPRVYSVLAGADSAVGSFIEPPPRLDSVLARVKAGRCH